MVRSHRKEKETCASQIKNFNSNSAQKFRTRLTGLVRHPIGGYCHIPDFRTQSPDYNYDLTRFFHLTMTSYEYLMTITRLTYIIHFILIPNSLAETVNP